MKEMDDLLNKLKELASIFVAFIKAVLKLLDEIVSKKIPNKTTRLVLGVVIVSFVFGTLFGGILSGGKSSKSVGKSAGGGESKSILRLLFGKSIPIPGRQPDGTVVLADFENPEELAAWKIIASKIDMRESHAVEGDQAAKVTYFKGQNIASIQMDDYFESRKAFNNWEPFRELRFSIYNPRSVKERIILQIKDRKGGRYKQDLHLSPVTGKEFVINLERVSNFVNLKQIEQLSFFVWKPGKDMEVYFDYVHLVPHGFKNSSVIASAPEIQVKHRPVNMMDYGFRSQKKAWLSQDPTTGSDYVRIPFIVKNETKGFCKECPVEGGIPLPMGEVKSLDQLRLRDSRGQVIVYQGRVLGRWPDQTLRWVNVHFKTILEPGQGAGYFLEYGTRVQQAQHESNLKVQDSPEEIQVDTGQMQIALDKNKFYLFKEIKYDKNGDGVYGLKETFVKNAALVLTFRKKEYFAHLDEKTYEIKIEEQGSEKVVIRASGWFQNQSGKRYCQVIIRYYLYRDSASMKIAHTLIYTGYPENNYSDVYKSMELPDNETIQHFGLRLPHRLATVQEGEIQVGQKASGFQNVSGGKWIAINQLGWDRSNLNVNGADVSAQDEHSGWASLSTQLGGMTFGVRHFKENYPKSFIVDQDKNEIEINLWPKEAGVLDLSTTSNAFGPEARARGSAFGFGKTHELFLAFHGDENSKVIAQQEAKIFMEPMIARANPYWIDATGVLGRIVPRRPDPYRTEENAIEKLFDWAATHPRDFKWYGMVNFGDTLSWWRNEDSGGWRDEYGWHPIGRWGWYNCEGLGLHTAALLQFARTGKWKYFEFGRNLARHIMDVDTVHYNTIAKDSRLGKLDEAFSQVGSMHRHNGDHWGGRNEEASHTSVVGLLLYHYLTGDERALEVAKEVGEFFLKEPFTYINHPDIAPHRGIANALWGDVLLYQATGNERYKRAADKLIQIYLNGQQNDGSFLETYNPMDHTWSGKKHRLYMEGYALGAIMSYHELTQDAEVEKMLLSLVKYLRGSETGIHGFAYAYLITGDSQYIDMANRALNKMLSKQKKSNNSLYDGLVYDKPIYHRPNSYIYPAGYALAMIDIHQSQKGRQS